MERMEVRVEALLHDESFVQPASRRNEVRGERAWGLRVRVGEG